MAERCLTLGCPEAVRLAKVDPCSGLPEVGEGNGYTLSCIRNWSIEPIIREGEASEFTADCGSTVVRDRQDDQLLGYTISFETSQRSNELEALVTGKELIEVGGTNIGTYSAASNLGCTEPSEDPRFVAEVFYKLSKCVTGADHVRLVLPMVQFKVTELDREGSIQFMRYTAESGISLASAFGDGGPYLDFPQAVIDFLALVDEDEYTTGFDFEESIVISGSCGAIEVPSPVSVPTCEAGDNFVTSVTSGGTGSITFTGTFPDFASFASIAITHDSGSPTYFPADPEVVTLNATTITITDALLAGAEVLSVLIDDGVGTVLDCSFDPVFAIDE